LSALSLHSLSQMLLSYLYLNELLGTAYIGVIFPNKLREFYLYKCKISYLTFATQVICISTKTKRFNNRFTQIMKSVAAQLDILLCKKQLWMCRTWHQKIENLKLQLVDYTLNTSENVSRLIGIRSKKNCRKSLLLKHSTMFSTLGPWKKMLNLF